MGDSECKKQEAGGEIQELPVTTASKVQALGFFQNMTFGALSFLFHLTFSLLLIYLCTDYTVSISAGHFLSAESGAYESPSGLYFTPIRLSKTPVRVQSHWPPEGVDI